MGYRLGMSVGHSGISLLYAKISGEMLNVVAFEKYELEIPLTEENFDHTDNIKVFVDNFVHKNRIKKKKMLMSLLINSDKLVVNTVSIPFSTAREMQKKLESGLPAFFSFDVSEFTIDYRILSDYRQNTADVNVLILGLPNTTVNGYMLLCEKIQFKPLRFDVVLNTIIKLFENDNKNRIVINMDSDHVNIVFLQGRELMYYRNISDGFNNASLLQTVVGDLSFLQKVLPRDFSVDEVVILGLKSKVNKYLCSIGDTLAVPVLDSFEIKWLVADDYIKKEACLLAASML